MDRFNNLNNTAPVVDVAQETKPKVQYSMFDLTRKVVGQALPYAIIPVDTIYTLPNSDYYLNYDLQVTYRNPTVRKVLNGFRVYLHSYYNRCSDLWEGWNNFITRGRSGNMTLEIPYVRLTGRCTPMSLYNYLYGAPDYITTKNINGQWIPILDKYTGLRNSNNNAKETGLANYANTKVNALKAVMYQRLWRDKYAPQNLLQDNKKLFPDNENHFILSNNATAVNRIDYGSESTQNISENLTEEQICKCTAEAKAYNQNYIDEVNVWRIRFRQFQGDRFTTASPFSDMLRGTAPTLDITINPENLKITIPANTILADTIKATAIDGDGATPYGVKLINSGYGIGDKVRTASDGEATGNSDFAAITTTKQEYNVTGSQLISAIKLKDLRALEVFTIFKERMARATGSYNSMIKAQYGYNPKAENREAIYIGGSYQDIVTNSIYQTNQDNNADTPLGNIVGQGISANYNKIGEFHSEDYGIIMTVMTIVPETIYTTGIEKLDTAITFAEQYFPVFNNLSAEPILNKELYVSGTNTNDENLYGYAERFSEYKSRRNKVTGFSSLDSTDDEYDSALVMARKFSSTQNLNAHFVTGTPDNVNLNCFASTEEPPFDFAIIQDVRAKLPMPYVTIPQGLGTEA